MVAKGNLPRILDKSTIAEAGEKAEQYLKLLKRKEKK
jgi:hypothetical protein